MDPNDPKTIARRIVDEYASEESPAFDLVWDNIGASQAASGAGPGQFMSEIVQHPMFAAIVIPIVIEVGKHLAKRATDALVDLAKNYLMKYRGKVPALADDHSITQVARTIVNAFSSKDA